MFPTLSLSGVPPSQVEKTVVTCLAGISGKALKVVGSGFKDSKARCSFAVPSGAKGKLLTGLVGATNSGSTLNRSFTLRVLAPRPRAEPVGRVTATLAPAPSGVSVRQLVPSSQRPVTGKRLFATITLSGLDASRGSLTCSGVSGGKPLRVLGSALKAQMPPADGSSRLV
jgi:hypothetical protein